MELNAGMLLTEPQEPRRRGRRRRASPPPAPTLAATPFECAVILDELSEPPIDELLWQAARDVHLWVSVAEPGRENLFGVIRAPDLDRVADACPELTTGFNTFTAMRVHPDSITGERISAACRECYEWARKTH